MQVTSLWLPKELQMRQAPSILGAPSAASLFFAPFFAPKVGRDNVGLIPPPED